MDLGTLSFMMAILSRGRSRVKDSSFTKQKNTRYVVLSGAKILLLTQDGGNQ